MTKTTSNYVLSIESGSKWQNAELQDSSEIVERIQSYEGRQSALREKLLEFKFFADSVADFV